MAIGTNRAPTILNWAGSKAQVAKALLALGLPEFKRYHEPFLGSGAAFLALASAGRIGQAYLSDTNSRLVNVFSAVQSRPNGVIAGLKLHSLLDSDIHFAASMWRMNQPSVLGEIDENTAADTIYLLAQSFHSAWYETRDGLVSLSRRQGKGPFRPRFQSVLRSSALLQGSVVEVQDFREALLRVEPNDLVFLDPPYLYAEQTSDARAYNANRFGVHDFAELLQAVRAAVQIGAHVVLCWSRADESELRDGWWLQIGTNAVWLSGRLADAFQGLDTPNCGRSNKSDQKRSPTPERWKTSVACLPQQNQPRNGIAPRPNNRILSEPLSDHP